MYHLPSFEVHVRELTNGASLPAALTRIAPGEVLSVWSGPNFAGDTQPQLVGQGAAVAFITSPTAPPRQGCDSLTRITAVVDPDAADLAGLTTARDHVPGDQVRFQPHFSALSRAWRELLANRVQFDSDSEAAVAQLARLGVALPTGFVSFGFGPHVPAVLIVARRTWITVGQRTWLVTICSDIGGVLQNEVAQPFQLGTAMRTEVGTMTRSRWHRAVGDVIARINAGQAEKVVMARDITACFDSPLDARALAVRLRRDFPQCWTFAVAGLIGASPEMLTCVRDGRVSSRVLAGTCAPGEGARLTSSPKDRHEHALAVSSVVSALEPLSRALTVSEEPYLLQLEQVTHLATEVRAELDSCSGLLEVLAHVHPSAAVCGTPTQAAFDLLSAFEATDRGRYTGPVGWLDADSNGACAIALRCGQLDAGRQHLRLFAGGGIMPTSDPDAELAETQAKMGSMIAALERLAGVAAESN